MTRKTLSVKLDGSEADGGNVSLTDFRDFAAALTSCLKRLEKKFDDCPRLDYLLVGLSRGSAKMKIAPTTTARDSSHGGQILDLFANTVRNLESGKRLDPRITGRDLHEFKKIVAPVKNKVRAVVINRTTLTTKYEANITKLLDSAVISLGSAKGYVESINVHNKHEFVLYPVIGEPITCTFSESLFERVRAALRQTVTITGRMHRYFGSHFPERATVDDIDIHPSDDELPKLSRMRGMLA